MFPAGGHLEWGSNLSDKIVKGDRSRTIVTKFCSNWRSVFRR